MREFAGLRARRALGDAGDGGGHENDDCVDAAADFRTAVMQAAVLRKGHVKCVRRVEKRQRDRAAAVAKNCYAMEDVHELKNDRECAGRVQNGRALSARH